MIVVPFSILPQILLERVSRIFYQAGKKISDKIPNLDVQLDQAGFKYSPKEYASMVITSNLVFLIIFGILTPLILLRFDVNFFLSLGGVFIVSIFIFIQQIMYPKLVSNKRIRDIERNLIPALQNLTVQLGAGVPLFNAMVIIGDSDYGGVSKRFKMAVKKINAGRPQISVLEEIAKNNPSLHFRRVVWQIINGMKTGSNMSKVIENSIDSLSEEQLIQIQRYGSQLNPLAMFYMIIAVIIPALGITFVILLSAFLGLSLNSTQLVFWGILAVVFFFQLMFMGMLKTRRPNLLE